jgi:signal transduction histidine kinase
VLENAHKYSPAGAPVSILVSATGAGAVAGVGMGAAAPHGGTPGFRVEIADRGYGICSDDLPRVFSPFFRADRSRTRATGGVGLGLALAKRVVEAHGGQIGIASQVDAGTTVTFVLPSADQDARYPALHSRSTRGDGRALPAGLAAARAWNATSPVYSNATGRGAVEFSENYLRPLT